jgi:hypothetical protein
VLAARHRLAERAAAERDGKLVVLAELARNECEQIKRQVDQQVG